MRAVLEPVLGDISVRRVGNCQSGWDWIIEYSGVPGAQDLLDLTDSQLSFAGGNVDVRVRKIEDGGIIMGPIPADYMHVKTSDAGLPLHVQVNKGAGTCRDGTAACGISFDESLNSALISIDAAPNAQADGATITVQGLQFDSPLGLGPTVVAGGFDCSVTSWTDTSAICSFSGCLHAGSHNVSVTVPGRGHAEGTAQFSMPIWLDRVEPAEIPRGSSSVITMIGRGFSFSVNENVSLGGVPCDILSSTCTQLVCVYQAAESARRSAESLDLTISGTTLGSVSVVTRDR